MLLVLVPLPSQYLKVADSNVTSCEKVNFTSSSEPLLSMVCSSPEQPVAEPPEFEPPPEHTTNPAELAPMNDRVLETVVLFPPRKPPTVTESDPEVNTKSLVVHALLLEKLNVTTAACVCEAANKPASTSAVVMIVFDCFIFITLK